MLFSYFRSFSGVQIHQILRTDAPVRYVVGSVSCRFSPVPSSSSSKISTLRRPISSDVAAYGHRGREDLNMPWDKTDLVDALKAEFGL